MKKGKVAKKSKNKVFNIVMVALIVVIAGCGIMAVGSIKGWFGGNSESPVVSEEIKGVANMERSGVGYSLDKDVPVKSGDVIETKSGSEAAFKISGKSSLIMNEKSELVAAACEENNLAFTLNEGEIIGDFTKESGQASVAFGNNEAAAENAVFSLSVRTGSAELNVYQGTVKVKTEDGDKEVKAGKQLLIAKDKNDKDTASIMKLSETSLNGFMIEKLKAFESDDMCFTADQLDKVVKDREKQKQEEQKALEKEAIAVVESQQSGGNGEGKTGQKVNTCTITIKCNTILNNMDNLKDGKNKYVPSNGIILATSSVQFLDGETAYDVTKRACNAAGIQMEAAYSPGYGSYYVEGINHLYEFDCGSLSGWMYKVNGWYPNYGCSEYKLKNGDSIVWSYTCEGAGADVK